MAGHVRSARWAPWAGIAFVALVVASVFVMGSTPDGSKKNAVELFTKYYGDNSNRTQEQISWILMVFAVVAFVWFISALWGRFRRAEGEAGPYAQLALLGGGGFALLLFLAISSLTAVSLTIDYSDAYRLDANQAILMQSVGYLAFVGAMLGAGAVTFASFILGRRTGVIPTWVAWLGLVIGVASLGIYFTAWFLMFGFLLWVLLVSITWVMTERRTGAVAETPAA
jgi:hypothetical protein